MDKKGVPNKYRPIPFWSWNENLRPEETARQIELMDKAGIGGYFMHARGGLQTPYMGEDWFRNIQTGIEEGNARGMEPWAYDEEGWPSGFGAGKVCGKGLDYQQKFLLMSREKPADESRIITEADGLYFYYDVNPYYVDVLSREVVADFIREVYEPYYARFGNTFRGFFTDEPQFARGMGWSFTLPEAYRQRYGEDLLPRLPELFLDKGDYQTTRVRYWKLVTDLFSQNYSKQLYDWCDSHGLQLTGHMMMEETFASQTMVCGAAMPNYAYYHIPGMDCLGRDIIWDLTAYQVGSVAQQLGKKQVMSETFAGCGHNVSFDELFLIYGHQMVHGINLLCPHLQGYSLRGIRKRDWPPAMYYQQPWWDNYERFTTSVARIGQILAEGEPEVDTLVLHPQTSAWALFNGEYGPEQKAFYRRFKKVVNDLDHMHIPFHLGDETILENHGRVEKGKFIVGQMAYSTVVVPEHILFFENTEKLLEQFRAEGGRIITPEELTGRTDVVDNPDILYTKRRFPDRDVYFFFNATRQTQTARLGAGSYLIDLYTGEKKPFTPEFTFAPCQGILVADDGSKPCGAAQKALKTLTLDGLWTLEENTPNVLTLDTCDYYFDGELQEKDGYVLNIQFRAVSLERPVRIRQEYRIMVETSPRGETFLVCETPEIYTITLNGTPVSGESRGWFVDKTFQKLDITGLLQAGENRLVLETLFSQTPDTYRRVKEATFAGSEMERNRLSYEMEIEPCYLIGDFGVRQEGDRTSLERKAYQFDGQFVLTEKPKHLDLRSIDRQGFPFFAGNMTLSREFDLEDENWQLRLARSSVSAVEVTVNGCGAGTILFGGDSVDCSGLLKPGKNQIRLKLVGTLRNMLGPHHLAEECLRVAPRFFYKELCPWPGPYDWVKEYCFVDVSVEDV